MPFSKNGPFIRGVKLPNMGLWISGGGGLRAVCTMFVT